MLAMIELKLLIFLALNICIHVYIFLLSRSNYLIKSQLYCLPVGYLTPYPYTNPFLDLLNISFLKRSLLDAVSKIKDSMKRLYLICTWTSIESLKKNVNLLYVPGIFWTEKKNILSNKAKQTSSNVIIRFFFFYIVPSCTIEKKNHLRQYV